MAGDKELKRILKALGNMDERVRGNPSLAKKNLVQSGIYMESGHLSPHYKAEVPPKASSGRLISTSKATR